MQEVNQEILFFLAFSLIVHFRKLFHGISIRITSMKNMVSQSYHGFSLEPVLGDLQNMCAICPSVWPHRSNDE